MAHELWDPGLSGSGSLEAHAHDIRKYYTIRYHTILYIYYTILWGSWFLGSPLRGFRDQLLESKSRGTAAGLSGLSAQAKLRISPVETPHP